jgi:hypothetical protein
MKFLWDFFPFLHYSIIQAAAMAERDFRMPLPLEWSIDLSKII